MNDELYHMEQQLAALAAGLCNDAGIQLRVHGEQWSYDPWRRLLTVSEESLTVLGEDWCAGRLVNEVGHYWLTRHDLFRAEFPSLPIAKMLLDALDDFRVDQWMTSRYPGASDWVQRVHETLDGPAPKPLPFVIEFIRECSLEPGRGFRPARYPVHPFVRMALDRTRAARQMYGDITPSVRMGHVELPNTIQVYAQHVMPRLIRPLFMPAPYEGEIRIRALEALELAEDEIFPIAEELLELDLQSTTQWLTDNPDQAREAQQGEMPENIPWGQEPQEGPPGPQHLEQLAQQLLEQMGREQQGETSERLCQNAGPPRPMPPGRIRPGRRGQSPLRFTPPTPSDYQAARSKMAAQIDQLIEKLERVLVPRQRMGKRAGYPSGSKVDMRRLMAFDADPRWYNKLWVRTTVPERRRAAFSLLVDLSGSMSGDKADTAFLGTVLLVETLNRLEIPFAVNGFQAEVIPFADFNEPFGSALRAKLAQMPSKADNCNDDGPCLLKVSEALLDQPVEDRIIIVVSDGQPSERDESEEDLRRAIETLNSGSVPLHLVGIGLGPDTEHVEDYYPDSKANVPVDQFASVIGELIARNLNVEL